jgi:hypothetical protein
MDLMHIEKTKQKEKCFPRLTAGSCQEMPITIEFLKKKKSILCEILLTKIGQTKAAAFVHY